MRKSKKIQFKDLSGWLKAAVIYVYVEMAMAALAILFLVLLAALVLL